ncbi:MAG: YggS family pyridoxal phosphate-dependent enzyme [Gammaproteobacteria bacterium]|nr:YggS family pyridoxal phosphate-dependent enzyme [Gammaproteobacteria bacterium]
MKNIAQHLAAFRESVHAAERRHGRREGSVSLLAVSKSHPATAIFAAAEVGQRDFGENYVQEALPKIAELEGRGLYWHFIGPLQSNKTRAVAAGFHWLHSLDRLRIASRVSASRPADLPALNVCLQVNISGERSKSGVEPGALPELAAAVAALPGLKLRGLMAMPDPVAEFETQRAQFRAVRECLEQLNREGHKLDTLSMGTTQDFEAAIAEGATIVRIGTGIFGQRVY